MAGCERPQASPDLALAGAQSSMSADTGSVTQPSTVRGDCVTPGKLALRGVLQREVRLGAPGYGETPKRDRRDTVVVLRLAAPLTLCPDSAEHRTAASPVHTRRIALRAGLLGIPRGALATGRTVTVYGTLGEASFAWEYGPLVLWVDSIPALRPPKRPSVA
jgi:hypothetical protein